MKYEALLGTEEFRYSSEVDELYRKMNSFMSCVADENGNTGTFEIIEEIVGDIPLFHASVVFPSWAEALFLIQFYEYSWNLMEES